MLGFFRGTEKATRTGRLWESWTFRDSKFAFWHLTRCLCWVIGTWKGLPEMREGFLRWFFVDSLRDGGSFTITRVCKSRCPDLSTGNTPKLLRYIGAAPILGSET